VSRWTVEADTSITSSSERLWRSLKQGAIYLEEIRDGLQAGRLVENLSVVA
jgi:hypothetical protein